MKKFASKIDMQVFLVPAILTVIILAVGVINPVGFGKVIDVAFNWISNNLGWAYDIGLFFLLIF